MIRKILLLLLPIVWVYGDIEDHFKPAPGKNPAVHGMRNIDCIYMINLDQRPEKFQMSLDQLIPFGIQPYRFSAVNGWEMTLEAINDVGVRFSLGMEGGFMATSYPLDGNGMPSHETIDNYGQTYFVHCLPRGAIGCALSHLSILQDAYDSGYKTIWVMEDDIFVVRNPHLLSDLIDELDLMVGENGWDVLFTDRDTKNQFGELIPCSSFAWRPNYTS